jgi:hypothetical protein
MIEFVVFLATMLFIVWVLVHTRPKCKHLQTRCIHGDEIWARTKVPIRWWKPIVVYRQSCMVCGKALDRDPICSKYLGQHMITNQEKS